MPPHLAELELVGQCNLRCRMCPSQFREEGAPWGPPAFMSWELFTRLTRELAGVPRLHLQGLGEPLLHPRFFPMVAHARARGFRVSLGTNGTLINRRRARLLAESGIDSVSVSVDAASTGAYEALRVRGSFRRVLRGLLLLSRAKARIELRIVAVAMRGNLHELPGLVRLARRLGVPKVFVQNLAHSFGDSGLPERYGPLRGYTDAQRLDGEEPQRVAEFFDRARQAAAECGIELRLPPLKPLPAPRCAWPREGAYITYRGAALPCAVAGVPERVVLGDVGRDGWKRVWTGAAYEVFRASLDSKNPPELCRHCALYRGAF